MLKQYITQTYGEVIHKLTTKLQKLKKQKASAKCRWIFLTRCLTHNILPKSFQTRPLLRTKRGFATTEKYNKEMLKVTRDDARVHHIKICKEIITTNKDLEEKMTPQDYTMIQEVTEKSRENKFIKERERLKNKFQSYASKISERKTSKRRMLTPN